MENPFQFQIGSYSILLPAHATITAKIEKPPEAAYQIAATHWTVLLGRFQLFIHLNPLSDLSELKTFTDYTTKSNVTTPSVKINGIDGVTHGDYGPPRTWIDWWFKKGDVMICLCLQSKKFPFTEPTQEEIAEHNAIINSLKYCRDFHSAPPPINKL